MTDEKNIKKEYSSARIQRIVKEGIQGGELLPGERLMSERGMAAKYNVSRMSVQYAMKELENEGYVERRRGAGTFISRQNIEKINLGGISNGSNLGITAALKNSGASISNRIITKGFVSAAFFERRLGMRERERAFILNRVRYSNGEPFAVEYTALPAEKLPGIDSVDFAEVSLYDYMGSYNLMPKTFNEKLQIVEVNAREAGYLEIGAGEPVYYTELTGFDGQGRIVEYTESYTRCDKAEIRFETRV